MATHSGGARFTREENELLTRVGPDKPMGRLFRQYWIPVLFPEELTPEKPQRRVRLLGEDLVAFRTRSGQVGLVGEFCSHRLASLYFGRVEGEAIRCLYHGWLYGPTGTCLEQGNLPAEHQFTQRIKHPGYRCVEYGGVIWAYMGPNAELPPLPEFEWALVPAEQRSIDKVYLECNYLQAMEGGIDPTHVMWLHSPIDLSDEEASSEQGAQQRLANTSGVRTPTEISLHETPYGFVYGTKRPMPDGRNLWRVNQWLMPFYTMPPGGDDRGGRMWVPVDDEHCVRWNLAWYPTREIMEKTTEKDISTAMARDGRAERDPLWVGGFLPETSEPYGNIRKAANRDNDYQIDWAKHYSKRMGVAGVGLQDICIVENEGPGKIMDRTKENLCGADRSTIIARRRLLEAARALQDHGTVPLGARDGSVYRVRGASIILPADVDFLEGTRETTTVPASA
jgi:phenylpropionate dioxygenase-like ring-hydroxylating dioxygenase large terminal subunit